MPAALSCVALAVLPGSVLRGVLEVGAVAVLAVAAALRASRPWLCSAASGGAADRMGRATPGGSSWRFGVAPVRLVFSEQVRAALSRAPHSGLPLCS